MHDVEEHLGSFLDDDYTVFTVQGPLHSATETTEWTTPAHGRVERIDVPADLVIPLEQGPPLALEDAQEEEPEADYENTEEPADEGTKESTEDGDDEDSSDKGSDDDSKEDGDDEEDDDEDDGKGSDADSALPLVNVKEEKASSAGASDGSECGDDRLADLAGVPGCQEPAPWPKRYDAATSGATEEELQAKLDALQAQAAERRRKEKLIADIEKEKEQRAKEKALQDAIALKESAVRKHLEILSQAPPEWDELVAEGIDDLVEATPVSPPLWCALGSLPPTHI